MSNVVRLEMKVSKEIFDELERISKQEGVTKGELLRKATSLLLFARDAKEHGQKIASVRDGQVITEVVGL